MKKIVAFAVAAGFCAGFSTMSSAQESPFRSCSKVSGNNTQALQCTVGENGLTISDVIWNRGNCPSSKANKSKMPPYTVWGIEQTYNFGSIASLSIYACPNVIEATIVTNKGNWTFKW